MASPSRAELWAQFAAASLANPNRDRTSAPSTADMTLKEFDGRFEWYTGGSGYFWRERDKKKETK